VIWPEGPHAPPKVKTLEALVIASGTVVGIGKHNTVMIRHRKAFMYVQWFGEGLPPEVKIGARVGFIGKLRTFNNGLRFQVESCLLLTRTPKTIINALMEMLPDMVKNPGDYLTDAEIEELVQPWE